MDFIKDIVRPLEERFVGGALATFHERRSAFKKGNARRAVLFSEIKNDDVARRGYAFHRGGRSELQFNIGFEGDGEWFRFGVAYSIETGPYFPDPVVVLEPSIERFNAVIAGADTKGLKMWRYERGHPYQPGPVHPVPDAWVRKGVFVFIGQRVPLDQRGVTPAILDEAARVLEQLWALYEKVEGKEPVGLLAADQRVARLCWNTNNWTAPSGRRNKSRLAKSFEGKHGYGHEEWLFDWAHVFDGWQYGFIQGIKPAHRGEVFDVLLYMLHAPSSVRYWVGVIHGVEVLDEAAARAATGRLHRSGALAAMRKEVAAFELKPETLEANGGDLVINVRFRQARAEVFDEPVAFERGELPMSRYVIQKPKAAQTVLFRPSPGRAAIFKRSLNTSVIRRTTYGRETDIDPVHARWQTQLEASIPKDLPGATAEAEMSIDGHAVDLIIEHSGLRVFVEIKTDPSPRRVIRAALSQLLEYAYHPEASRCGALVIAGAFRPSRDDEAYLAMLRERFGIPVHFLQIEAGRLVGLAGFWTMLSQLHQGRTGLRKRA